jgi:predicted DNA-binding ribbon-helix-helix protein
MAKQPKGPSLVGKRTVNVAGRKTSVSVEETFWNEFKKIAATKGVRASRLVSMIDNERQDTNLSSAIRLFVLEYYRGKSDG